MANNKGKFHAYLYSSIGLILMAILLIAINIIARGIHFRTDLTEDKLYTLSDGSHKILSKLKSPVSLRFYCTRGKNEMPISLKSYAKRVEDLLEEYRISSNGKIKIEKYDPLPDSDAEDAAALDGIDGQLLSSGEKIYLGLAVSSIDTTMSIPFMSPNNENTLEYDISRLIYRISNPNELVIGVMSSLPVMGSSNNNNPMMPPQMSGQKPPWVFISELKKDHEVREVETTVDSIPEDISMLLVIHPKDLPDKTQFAIDQFILRGGKLIGFVDPVSIVDSQNSPPQMRGLQQSNSSSLDKLLNAWGITFDTKKIVADMAYTTEVGGQGGQPQTSPTIISVDNRAMNKEDIVSSSLDNVILAYSGAFSGEPLEGLTKSVLIKSSKQSQLVDSFKAQLPANAISKDFKPEDKEHELAIRLVGKFKTAFPNGAPDKDEDEDEDEDENVDNKNEASDKEKSSDFLTESKEVSAVILVADVDAIHDDFWVRKTSFFGQTIHQLFSDNNNLLQNSVEQLSGDSSLISIRSRGVANRPFLVVKKMQLEAEKKYKEEINRLEEEVAEAQRKINDLQTTKKDQDQRFILSPEQTKELEKFREKKVEVNKRLKELRKQLRRDIDRLETNLKWYNIGLIPILVSLSGITFGIIRRKKTVSR